VVTDAHRAGEDFWTDREAARRAEWLETNGLGGYASSTLAGLNTRRYHGLLVAAAKPPVGRAVLLSKLEETLVLGDDRFELSVNRYADVVSPEGDRFLTEFSVDPFPRWVYRAGGAVLTKTLFLVNGEDTLVVSWELARGGEGARLDVRPLVAFRDYHSLTHENGALDGTLDVAEGRVTIRPYPSHPALTFGHDAGELDRSAYWYRGFEYDIERESGFDCREDLYSPFRLVFSIGQGRGGTLVASTKERGVAEAPALRWLEDERRRAVTDLPDDPPALRAFRRAADQFLVARGEDPRPSTVIAGYPWFTDWGRDTMIALPGLTLATGRHDVARRILETFAAHVDGGMIPNRFPDEGAEPEYNTVDATLWFVDAVRAFRDATKDETLVDALFPTLLAIVEAHEKGTRYGIRVDADGLLASGAEGVQLTWMDARIGEHVVTPRRGKPVEIQALWFNALSFLAGALEDRGDVRAARITALAARARESFDALFWNEEAGCLYDVVDGGERDASIRPNQVLALSLAHPLVTGERAARVLEIIERHLLTPYGLRTLSPSDPRYRGRYEGGPPERDGAYHQGTAWPWLLGPFVLAHLRSNGNGARQKAAEWLRPLVSYMLGPGLGQVPEIFDGDAPQRPAGCFAQAWSVAQLIEAITVLGSAYFGAGPPAKRKLIR
jgi:predicted glycogen debranching enzyme